jgi:hypothetical protein
MTPAAGQGGFSTDDGPDWNDLWNRGAFDELLVPVITP